MSVATEVTRVISYETARTIIDYAHERAEALNLKVAVCVADPAGHLIAAGRMDGTPFGATLLSVDKAFAAASLMAATGNWQSVSQPGGPEWGMNTTLGGRLLVIPGGLVILEDGQVVGAVGVSGGECSEDVDCGSTAIERAGLTPG